MALLDTLLHPSFRSPAQAPSPAYPTLPQSNCSLLLVPISHAPQKYAHRPNAVTTSLLLQPYVTSDSIPPSPSLPHTQPVFADQADTERPTTAD